MRVLAIFLGITLAASVVRAEALGTTGAPAPTEETAAPAPAPAEASEQAPAVTMAEAAATLSASTVLGAVAALAPAVSLASTGALAIGANNPFDGGDTDEVADAEDADEGETVVVAKIAPPEKVALPGHAPSEQELRVQYQRIGRDLLKLEEQRGKFDCGGMIPQFKAIKLEQALATPASRMQLYVDLTDMASKIDRFRGIHIESQCLQNPLASGCM